MHELNLDLIIEKVKEAYSPENPPENVISPLVHMFLWCPRQCVDLHFSNLCRDSLHLVSDSRTYT